MIPCRLPFFHALAVACWATAFPAPAATLVTHTEPDGTKLIGSSPFGNYPSWAFVPLDLEALTPGKEVAEWRLDLTSGGYREIQMKSPAVFEARPGATRGAVMLVKWSSLRHSYESSSLVVSRVGGGREFNSIGNDGNDMRTLTTFGTGKFPGTYMITENFNPAYAPLDWRGYCGFHRIFLTDDEWSALSPAARAAVLHWTRLGGNLVILRKSDGQTLSQMGIPQPDGGVRGGAVSHGTVAEGAYQASGGPVSWQDSVKRVQAEDVELARKDWVDRVLDGNTQSDWRREAPGMFEGSSGRRMSGLMVAVVLVFAIVAGPVNVFALASARRRHRLFFTTPLISLVAGGMLVLAVILSDGLGGKGQRFVWLENVPGENMSYVVQHQHSRCGAMFSTGFEIPEPAYFVPMVDVDSAQAGSFGVTVGADKVTATGPWFSSRREQGFFLSAARSGRGRIELGGAGGHPVLTSAFDFPLDRMYWLDKDGKTWWQAGAMAQGTATPLTACSRDDVLKGLTEFTGNAPVEYRDKLASAIERPGFFVAIAGKIAAIETHRGIRWQTHGIVTGPAVTP